MSESQNKKTRNWVVVFLIHVRTPHEHIPKLVIKHVPVDLSKYDVMDFCESMGYGFGEFGIAWANHYVCPLKDAPSSVKGAYRKGEIETIEWKDLNDDDLDE